MQKKLSVKALNKKKKVILFIVSPFLINVHLLFLLRLLLHRVHFTLQLYNIKKYEKTFDATYSIHFLLAPIFQIAPQLSFCSFLR